MIQSHLKFLNNLSKKLPPGWIRLAFLFLAGPLIISSSTCLDFSIKFKTSLKVLAVIIIIFIVFFGIIDIFIFL